MILIDIGSMKGEEIVWGLKNGYEVHAFEPNPNMKPFLQPYESLATINYAAAWNKNEMVKLYMMSSAEPGEDGLSVIKEKTNVSKDNFIEVPAVNIGMYLANLNKDIDILKINAEGAEYFIIDSILKYFNPKRIKRWLVEDHQNYIKSDEWTEYKKEVLQHLADIGITLENYHGL